MFESPTFEDQPLVPTDHNTGKFDIDSFLSQAKEQQKRWFISTSIFAFIALSYGLYLSLYYPGRFINPINISNGLVPMDHTCLPKSGPGYGLTSVNMLLLLLPLVLWADQLRSFLRPAPSNGPGVIVFKPYYVRSASNDDQVTTPEQYFRFIRDRSINWLQSVLLALSITSLIGFFVTMVYTNQDLCINSSWNLGIPYLVGACATVTMFLAVLITMVYQHKKHMLSFTTPIPSSSSLDAYHPL